MNTLASARQEIKHVLDQAGYTVWSFIPERVTPPVVVLEPGSPYMNEGDAFTLFVCRFDLILLAATATNSKATEDLDQMIMDCVDALDMYYIEEVSKPMQIEANGVAYLGTTISISDKKEIKT